MCQMLKLIMPWEPLSVLVPKSGLPCCDNNDSRIIYVLNKVIPQASVLTQTWNAHAVVITLTLHQNILESLQNSGNICA